MLARHASEAGKGSGCVLLELLLRHADRLVGVEVDGHAQRAAESAEEEDVVVSIRGSNHVFGFLAELERVAQQVEDEGKVDVAEVDEVFVLGDVHLLKVLIPLVTVEPTVVQRRAQRVSNCEKWVIPATLVRLVQLESIQLGKRLSRVQQTLVSKRVVRHGEARIEGHYIIIQS